MQALALSMQEAGGGRGAQPADTDSSVQAPSGAAAADAARDGGQAGAQPASVADKERVMHEGLVATEWLQRSAAQLTYHGLVQLHDKLGEGELCVFFRNNHFSTLVKVAGELYLLATDLGYLHEPDVVWERLNQIDGDSELCDGAFRRVDLAATTAAAVAAAATAAEADAEEQAAIQASLGAAANTDFALPDELRPPAAEGAVHDSDLALALQLQREEEEAFAQHEQQAALREAEAREEARRPPRAPPADARAAPVQVSPQSRREPAYRPQEPTAPSSRGQQQVPPPARAQQRSGCLLQ